MTAARRQDAFGCVGPGGEVERDVDRQEAPALRFLVDVEGKNAVACKTVLNAIEQVAVRDDLFQRVTSAPPNWQVPAQLPPMQPPVHPAAPGNLQNQQPSFVNGLPHQDPRGAPNPSFMGGTVYGRLLNKGRPLVNCHVVIVPLHEVDGVNRFDSDRTTLTTLTDEEGVFHFENAPAGGYKLMWLPEGQNQWIRRISMHPDVKVHNDETTTLKEIRVALQTIN
ncbi:MAG: hypothetical protein ABR915_01080 [Thermoguttaceae bacterium]